MALESRRRIESKEVALTSAGSWAGTIFFFAFSAGFFLLALFRIRDFIAILISGFFALWGVAGIVMMIRKGASQQRYGPLPIELEGSPAVGGRLRASLRLPAAATTTAPLSLRAVLTCTKVTYAEQGARVEEPVQGLRKVVAVARGPSGARVTFDFEIPPDLPYTNDPGRADAVPNAVYGTWELKVDALGGVTDLSRSYDIPIARALPAAVPPAPAAPDSQDGPIEIVRPSARAFLSPTVLPMKPAAVTSATEPDIAAPMLLPEDDQTSLWVLVAINLIPLGGVFFLGWRVHEIVFLYWIENLVIGAANVLRMRIAVPDNLATLRKRGVEPSDGELTMAKAMLIGFFIVHYGAFCWGHGVFLAGFFPPLQGGSRELGAVLRSMLLNPATLAAIIGIMLSHAYSYFHNYVGRGEYLRADLAKMMFQPYKRIVVTHLFIIFGGFLVMTTRNQVLPMALFIALKIGLDMHAHRRERRQLAPSG